MLQKSNLGAFKLSFIDEQGYVIPFNIINGTKQVFRNY